MKVLVVGISSDKNTVEVDNWIYGMNYLDLDYVILDSLDENDQDTKSKIYHNFLRETTADIILFSDINSVLPNLKIKELCNNMNIKVEKYIIDIFLSYNRNIVVGGERLCSPYNDCYQSFGNTIISDNYDYPSSSLVIGYRSNLLYMFDSIAEDMCSKRLGSIGVRKNKYCLGYYALNNKKKVYIETEGVLFNNYYNKSTYFEYNRCQTALFSNFDSKLGYNKFSIDLGYIKSHVEKSSDTNMYIYILILVLILLFIGYILII